MLIMVDANTRDNGRGKDMEALYFEVCVARMYRQTMC